jgi:hypothetical protein
MKRAILASVATLTFAAAATLLGGSVNAQNGGYFGGRPDDGWGASRGMPGGSWRESCRFPNMRGPLLVAQCRTSYDRWVDARIDPNNCRGGRLANDDGRLVCEISGGGWGNGGSWEIPGGSWRESCRYPVMRGRLLSAQCRSSRGDWSNVTIDIRACRSGRLQNIEGNLTCEGGRGGYGQGGGYGNGGNGNGGGYGNGGNGNGGGYGQGGNASYPGGSWRETCRASSMRGDVLSAQCKNRNGNWNNSSIDVHSCRSNRVSNDDGQLVCR